MGVWLSHRSPKIEVPIYYSGFCQIGGDKGFAGAAFTAAYANNHQKSLPSKSVPFGMGAGWHFPAPIYFLPPYS